MWTFLKHSFGKRLWIWMGVLALGLIILLAPSPFSKAQMTGFSETRDAIVLLQADNKVNSNPETIRQKAHQVSSCPLSTQPQFLNSLAQPLLAYLLLMIGFYGILFEVTHPGFGLPGVAGAICLFLSIMGMQALPVNMVGLGLIFLGLAFFIAEVFTPSFGFLFGGGLISLVLGTAFLYQSDTPYFQQITPYMVGISVILGLLTGLLLLKIMKTAKRKAKGPYDKLIGQIGKVVTPIEPGKPGKIRVYGEIWNAEAEEALSEGMDVKVIGIDTVDTATLKVVALTREV